MARTDHRFFELEFNDLDALRAAHGRCRERGVARIPGVSVALGERCELIFLCNDVPTMSLRGQVVARHAEGIELRLDAPVERMAARPLVLLDPIEPLVIPLPDDSNRAATALDELPTQALASDNGGLTLEPQTLEGLTLEEPADEVHAVYAIPSPPASAVPEEAAPAAADTRPDPPPRKRNESTDPLASIRNLGVAHQIKLARSGAQRERVALERIYGKTVWEALLCNPRITSPEVARIARKGALPKPLVALIAENPSWLTSASVRRALLSNPRLTRPLALKVLRKTPKHEIKLVPNQTAYPAPIRELARKLLKDQGVS